MDVTESVLSDPRVIAVLAFAVIGLIAVIRWMWILWLWMLGEAAPTERQLDIIEQLSDDREYDPYYQGPWVPSSVAKANEIIDHLLRCPKRGSKERPAL